MKPARLATSTLTRHAGHGSFARAVFHGAQQLACIDPVKRPGHQPEGAYEDRSMRPGAGKV